MAAAGSMSRKMGASVVSAKRLCSARSFACRPGPVAYHPRTSRLLNVSAYWSRFWAKVSRSKSGAPEGSAGSSTTSKEFETSTDRPLCWPSRQPSTRGMAAAPGARVRMQWSLMLMSTSCMGRTVCVSRLAFVRWRTGSPAAGSCADAVQWRTRRLASARSLDGVVVNQTMFAELAPLDRPPQPETPLEASQILSVHAMSRQ